jgi:formylmethanofuran dehydrogenase subunit B
MPTIPADVPNSESPLIEDVTCTFCGCLCDDIALRIEGDRIAEARNACHLGESWFLNRSLVDQPVCLIEGRPASLEEGIDRAAQILVEARYPLVFGLSETTTESQRLAIAIADRVGACVDSTSGNCYAGPVVAFQEVGQVTCTLGEIRNRGDLIIFWGSDPAESHPRHFERYSLDPRGTFVPQGRADRFCVVVDSFQSKSAILADQFIQFMAGREFESFWVLLALVKGIELDPAQVQAETSVPLTTWQALVNRMKQAKYGVIFHGGNSILSRGDHIDSHALLALVRALNDHTRFVCMRMTGDGNPTGAENALTWQTGYPYAVNLSRGYPRYGPGEYNAGTILERGECDAAMTLGYDAIYKLDLDERKLLTEIPSIVLGPYNAELIQGWSVAFQTSTYGINTTGTAFRMDGVPIPLRPALQSPFPGQEEILQAIEKRVRTS